MKDIQKKIMKPIISRVGSRFISHPQELGLMLSIFSSPSVIWGKAYCSLISISSMVLGA